MLAARPSSLAQQPRRHPQRARSARRCPAPGAAAPGRRAARAAERAASRPRRGGASAVSAPQALQRPLLCARGRRRRRALLQRGGRASTAEPLSDADRRARASCSCASSRCSGCSRWRTGCRAVLSTCTRPSERRDRPAARRRAIARLFLAGFATSALLGPSSASSSTGAGASSALLYSLFYSLGAVSTRACACAPLRGRVAGGVGASLLFSAPEAWLVGEHARRGLPGSTLGAAFGWAFFGDSIVAISAGLLAQAVASRFGPSAPFLLSVPFLGGRRAGRAHVARTPRPAAAAAAEAAAARSRRRRARDRRDVGHRAQRQAHAARRDAEPPRARCTSCAAVAAALIGAIRGGAVPFGKVFSCLMACCMIGSSLFSALSRGSRSSRRRSPCSARRPPRWRSRRSRRPRCPRSSRPSPCSRSASGSTSRRSARSAPSTRPSPDAERARFGRAAVLGDSEAGPSRRPASRRSPPALQVHPRREPRRRAQPLRDPAQPHRDLGLPLQKQLGLAGTLRCSTTASPARARVARAAAAAGRRRRAREAATGAATHPPAAWGARCARLIRCLRLAGFRSA